MSATIYYSTIATLLAGVWLSPWLEEATKVFVVWVVIMTVITITALFKIALLRDLVVKHIVAAVLQQIMTDGDMQKLMDVKGMQERIYQRVRKDLKKKKPHEDQN